MIYHLCKYCGKIYKHKQSLTNHIKNNCDINKEDTVELIHSLYKKIDLKIFL